MPEVREKMPETENQQRELEEELEHLEEDVDRRGLFAKVGDIVKKLFAGPEDERAKE